MYNLEDRSYLQQPRIMPEEVVLATADRIAKHVERHGITSILVVIHGGEPLLTGKEWMRRFVNTIRHALPIGTECKFSLQTNGVLLDSEWIQLFVDHKITVGLSLDGPQHINDKWRVNHAGRGSYLQSIAGLELLLRSPDVYAGVLCVVDPEQDGLYIYRHFRELGITNIEFLLPAQYNWDNPPPGHADETSTSVADYLIPIFDNWWAEDNPMVSIRLFDNIIRLLFGYRERVTDAIGGNPMYQAVINTDGSIELPDVLRACSNELVNIGLNVENDSIDAVYAHPAFALPLAGLRGLCATCKACALHDVCGGGYLPMRFSRKNGFDNPNVFCRDLWKLITHIAEAVTGKIKNIPDERLLDYAKEGAPLVHQ